jgi:hypothetical protein
MNTTHTFRSPEDFGRTVPLQGLVIPNQAAKELYRTTEWVVDTTTLSQRFHEAGFTDGLDIAIDEIEARLSFLNEQSR